MNVTAQPLAFRCSKCFQVGCSSTDCVGQSLPCEYCGQENVVPPATEERISQALDFLAKASTASASAVSRPTDFSQSSIDMTDAEIMRQAKLETYNKAHPSKVPASKLKRFLGAMVDVFVALTTYFVGFFIAAILAPATGSANEVNLFALSIMFGLPLMLALVQMILVATEGKTIGKYCVKTKIVNDQGELPGFFQGVFMRMIVNGFLAIIPFYGLIDAAVIFANEGHRCIHDMIAGTYVVDCLD